MGRVMVVTSSPLFAEGGHLVIARALVRALRDRGHDAGLKLTPQNRFGRQGSAYLATWLTDFTSDESAWSIDAVISMRYPSYAARHPRHVCWLNHTMREYYDLWEEFSSSLPARKHAKESVRRWLIHRADGWLLTKNVRRVFAQSATIQGRLASDLRVSSEVLYPPAPQRDYRCESYEPYIFAVSRLAPLKRLDLLVDALALPAAAGARCVIAGEGSELDALRRKVGALGLDSRVSLIGRIDDATLVDHLGRCRAVCFVPKAEDFGLVTVEAFASRKAVITCHDSGGPAELVEDGVNGFVVSPTAEAVAAAVGRLVDDGPLAERLGAAGLQLAAEHSWDRAIARLLGDAGRP
jgi:glycosyltransferase involved in cell wall biosynthesis